jgi:hypothetical protein
VVGGNLIKSIAWHYRDLNQTAGTGDEVTPITADS